MSLLDKPYFRSEKAAYAKLESILWPNGPICPHCGAVDRITEVRGKTARMGLKRCGHCKLQFTVTVGTVFERSHVPLHKWLQAAFLLCSSKKGISAHQLHRTLDVTYKTAWFMAHRLREGMRPADPQPLGGGGKTVEVDETYWGSSKEVFHSAKRGRPAGWRKKTGTGDKLKILTLVERDGQARSFHVANVKSATLRAVIHQNLKRDTHFMTDEFNAYKTIGLRFITHRTVNHSIKEYVRGGKNGSHTNTIENFFSIFKRGLTGTYQHISEKHLKRYLCEFDFRYNERKIDDSARTVAALAGITGKRLLYRDSSWTRG